MKPLITISIILAFFVINAVIIKIFHRKQDDLEEYAVGGRSFPWFLSMFGFIGAWYVGTMYTGWFGDSATIGLFAQYLAVYSLGTVVTMFVIVRPVWVLGKVYQLETNADLLGFRYNSKAFEVMIAICTFLFWSPWLIVEMKTIGYLVSAATYGVIPFNVGLVAVSSFVVIYCWLGGARAGVIGSLVQGLFFTVVGTATVLFLFYKIYGGILPMFKMVAQKAPELLVINDSIGVGAWSSAIIAGALGGMMNPDMFARLYMTKNVTEAKKAVLFVPLIGAIFVLIVLWLGLGGSLLNGFPKDAQSGIFWMAEQYGGPVVVGLMGIFALAASMSTISAGTTAAAVLIGKNLLGFLKLNRRQTLLCAKTATLIVGIILMFVATMEITRLVSLVLYLYDCLVQVSVPVILGLYWKRGNVYGAATGVIAGMSIVILRDVFPWLTSWAGDWSAGLVGLLINLILYIAVSLLTKKQANVDEIFRVLEARATRQENIEVRLHEEV